MIITNSVFLGGQQLSCKSLETTVFSNVSCTRYISWNWGRCSFSFQVSFLCYV